MQPLRGTVTFLFSDIEGSTRLLQQLGGRYAQSLEQHQRLMRAAIASLARTKATKNASPSV